MVLAYLGVAPFRAASTKNETATADVGIAVCCVQVIQKLSAWRKSEARHLANPRLNSTPKFTVAHSAAASVLVWLPLDSRTIELQIAPA